MAAAGEFDHDYAPETEHRKEIGLKASKALCGAHLIGVNHAEGTVCAWYGGAGFNVYDADGFEELGHFTMSAGFGGEGPEELLPAAKTRMAAAGFSWEDNAGNGR